MGVAGTAASRFRSQVPRRIESNRTLDRRIPSCGTAFLITQTIKGGERRALAAPAALYNKVPAPSPSVFGSGFRMPASTRALSKGTLACGADTGPDRGRAVTPRNLAPRDLGVRLRQQSLKTVVRHKSTAGSNSRPLRGAPFRPARYPTRHTEITRPLRPQAWLPLGADFASPD